MIEQDQQAPSAAAVCASFLKRYPDVIAEISSRDEMYNSGPEPKDAVYGALGRMGLDVVRLAMLAAQKEVANSILDLPSGHGRVLRYLKAEYPDARLSACDIHRDGVDFCAQALGATPIYGQIHPKNVEVHEKFDLIWCGSLLTHLDVPMWHEFLDFFESLLDVGGLLIFTTHGRSIASRLRNEETGPDYLADGRRREAILDGYESTGFGYADYDIPTDYRQSLSLPVSYGISLTEPSWVCRLVEKRPHLQLVSYMENRWGCQDVVAYLSVESVTERGSHMTFPLGGVN